MSTSIIEVIKSILGMITSLNLTPAYLLIIGALIGYFRHQHEGKKVPGSLSIPKDLLKSTEFNKLWTLLYVLLLPLSWAVNVVAHAVYALMWLVDIIGSVVRWAADKLYWLWNQIVLGLGGFSFYMVWHYLVKWPYELFRKMLSTFVESFNWGAYKSSYRTVAIASLVGVSGFLVDDLVGIDEIQFSNITIVLGAIMLLNAVGSHMAEAMGVKPRGMRPTYAILIVTAIIVFVVEQLAQDYLLLNDAAGILGGIVLGVSVATWIYGILIAAALVQFLSLLVPAYLASEGPFNWLEALRTSFASRWLKSIGSIALFVIAYNTLGLWVYDNVQQVAAEPYDEYRAAVAERISDNEEAMEEATATLMEVISSEDATAEELDDAYAAVRSIEAGNAFWSAVPTQLRDVVYMDVNEPFTTEEDDVTAAAQALADFDSAAAQRILDYDMEIEMAMNNLTEAKAERNRISADGITASEDGAIEEGQYMRFGMPIPADADNIRWRITNEDGDTIRRTRGETMRHRFDEGSYEVHAVPENDCGLGEWVSYDVEVNESPESPLRVGKVRGRTEVCAGDEYTYTVPAGMDSYKWDAPSGASVDDDGNTATIKWGTTSGDVSVYGKKDGERSNTSVLYVTVSAAPGEILSDEGSAGNEDLTVAESIQDNFVVLAEEGDRLVKSAQAQLDGLERDKAAYEAYAASESLKLNAQLVDLEKRHSSNILQMIMNLLGKALFLFVACLLLAVALNFVVVWVSKYFGSLYNYNQDGPTYFRSSLEEYQSKYDGFPYLGLFVLVVAIVLGGYLGIELTQSLSDTLQEGDFPMLMDVIDG
jgi:hypothetical protein